MPGTRCDARSDASKPGAQIGASPNRCQAPGATPGRMLANRELNRCEPKSVPGTWCNARLDASKAGAKSVPGTWCDARSDASKPEAQIGTSKEDGDARPRRAMLRRADARPRRAMLRRWLASCAQAAGDRVDGQQQLRDQLVRFLGLLHAMVAPPHLQKIDLLAVQNPQPTGS